VLALIGGAYDELGHFERAADTYRRALADPKARQPFSSGGTIGEFVRPFGGRPDALG